MSPAIWAQGPVAGSQQETSDAASSGDATSNRSTEPQRAGTGPQQQDKSEATASPASAATEAILRGKIEAIEANTEIPEVQRTRIAELYRQSIEELQAQAQLRESLKAINQQRAAIEPRTEEVRGELQKQPSDPAIEDATQLSGKEVQERLSSAEAREDEIEKKLAELTEVRQQGEQFRADAPEAIAQLASERNQLQQERTNISADVDPELAQARRTAIDIKLQNNELRRQLLEAELAYYDRASNLIPLEIQLAQRNLARAQEQARRWRLENEERRTLEAEQDVEQKARQVRQIAGELKPIADANLQWSEKLRQIADKIRQIHVEYENAKTAHTYWEDQFKRVSAVAGSGRAVSESVGNVLREQRSQLPNIERLDRKLAEYRNESFDARSQEFEVEKLLDQLNQPADLEVMVDQHLDKIQPEPTQREQLRSQLKSLLESRKETLEKLDADYNVYLEELRDLTVQLELLKSRSEAFATFIDERVLWIRSVPPVTFNDLAGLTESLQWFVSIEIWQELWEALRNQAKRRPLMHLLMSALVLVSCVFRRRGIRQIEALGVAASSPSCRSFGVTFSALGCTIFCAIPAPLIAAWIAYTADQLADNDSIELADLIQHAATHAGCVLGVLMFWKNVLRYRGLAENHFQWTPQVVQQLRRQLRWFVPTIVPLIIFFHLFNGSALIHNRSVARFVMVAICWTTALIVHRLLSPSRGLTKYYFAGHREGWLYRLRRIWYTGVMAIPISMGFLALGGYVYTAQQLSEQLFLTATVFSTLLLFEHLAFRAIMINHRGIAIAQARERLAHVAAGESKPPGQSEPHAGVTADDQINLSVVNEQTRRLLTSFVVAAAALGAYLIWIDVIPALGRLNDFEISGTGSVQQTVTETGDAAADTVASSVEVSEPIRLGDLLGSLFILVLTWIAIRNIPGLLEIAVLQHLPLDQAARFATTTVTRYALIIAGAGWALNTVGFGWSKIQWLAAAISVGLGFGLQEIFANFVSGLILLFERPLRAGDVVTVGDVTGTVVQIRTRATTIQDWDRKELVVPNKEFITGRLLNWTLNDTINRIVLPVGVAYGSNIKHCRQILLEAAHEHPAVLGEPEPSVTFDLFGDSALNLTLRCYLSKISDRLGAIHELHESIYNKLAHAGITIPFPQRDVHLKQQPEKLEK